MREAIIQPNESPGSPRLFPNEHLRLLVELLRVDSVELSRRWLAALLLVPEAERAELVAEIERRIVKTYAEAPESVVEMHVVSPPVQKDGYVEQIHTTYSVEAKPERDETPRNAADAG